MLSLTSGLFRSLLFNCQVLEIFLVSFCYWFLVLLHCGRRIHSIGFQFFHFYWGLFYGSGYHGHFKKEYAFCCPVEWFINVDWITLADDITEFFYMLDDSLSAATATAAKSLQSCPTLCDPIDGLLPGSSVLGILQARTMEWVAISFFKSIVKREGLKSPIIIMDFYVSFHFCKFLLHIVCLLFTVHAFRALSLHEFHSLLSCLSWYSFPWTLVAAELPSYPPQACLMGL